ncbi:DUF6993 domain-containing protein [Salinibacterium sp.]|uniref:DUF6993 domain-containing protein n=1 Tax=Salinibacterium sp. TaxID=1915057 RepID=UPI00286C2CC0|nr:hypothetical protein [Salinibacterium sp.]
MRARTSRLAGAVLGVMILLTACIGQPPAPPVTADPSGSSPAEGSGSPTPTLPPTPALVAGGTAAENKPFFDEVNQQYFIAAGNVIPEGRGVVDNLVSVGFIKADMQITADRTAIDLPVDSLVFSVLMGDQCLVGQFSAQGYSTIIAPKLSTGSCLVGLTRAIDW